MGKGSGVAVAIFACALVAACSSAEPRSMSSPWISPTVSPAISSVTSPAPIPEPDAERAVPPARERLVVPTPMPTPAALSITTPVATPEPKRWDAVPVVADTTAALVRQLVDAERAVRDPAVTGDELAYMGHLQQLVYRRLIEHPALRAPVFAAIPADLRAAADFNLAAGADLWLFGPVRVTALPAWRIVQPAPIDELLSYYREAEIRFGVPWYYLAAINLVETRMGRIRGASYAGAQGPMQFMPATWAAYGKGDINDVRDAIIAAGRYLRAAGAPAKMAKAIWAYNHDDEYVDAVTKYAEVMRADPSAYRGYYGWQVYFITASGTILLPVGYSKP